MPETEHVKQGLVRGCILATALSPSVRRSAPALTAPHHTLRLDHPRPQAGSHRLGCMLPPPSSADSTRGFWKKNSPLPQGSRAAAEPFLATALSPSDRRFAPAPIGPLHTLRFDDLKLIHTDWDACHRNLLQPIRHGVSGGRTLRSAQQIGPEWSAVFLVITEHLPRKPRVMVAGASDTWPSPRTAQGQSATEEGRAGDQARQTRPCALRRALSCRC